MKTTKTYIKEFNTESEAYQRMTMKNRSCKLANNKNDIYCLVDGPSDNFAVVDLRTAIELGNGYQIA